MHNFGIFYETAGLSNKIPFHHHFIKKPLNGVVCFCFWNQRYMNGKLIDYCFGIDMNAMPKMRFICLFYRIVVLFQSRCHNL